MQASTHFITAAHTRFNNEGKTRAAEREAASVKLSAERSAHLRKQQLLEQRRQQQQQQKEQQKEQGEQQQKEQGEGSQEGQQQPQREQQIVPYEPQQQHTQQQQQNSTHEQLQQQQQQAVQDPIDWRNETVLDVLIYAPMRNDVVSALTFHQRQKKDRRNKTVLRNHLHCLACTHAQHNSQW